MAEHALVQRILILFDHCISYLHSDQEDELMIYYLLSCMYLCLKVENRISLSFTHFWDKVVQLGSFTSLLAQISLDLSHLHFDEDRYPYMEKYILEVGVKFKIDFVSSAQVIF